MNICFVSLSVKKSKKKKETKQKPHTIIKKEKKLQVSSSDGIIVLGILVLLDEYT